MGNDSTDFFNDKQLCQSVLLHYNVLTYSSSIDD